MSSLSEKTLTLIDYYTQSTNKIPIVCLPKGLDGNVCLRPCIFLGPKGRPVLIYSEDITIELLEKIFNKALKDNNIKATVALLHYAVYNKKAFWQRYKNSELGIQVMAQILGQHE